MAVRHPRWPAVMLAAALVFGACGDGDVTEAVGSDGGPTDSGAFADSGGFADCGDFPELRSAVTGDLGATSNPDDGVMAELAAYGAERPDTFAGLWIDRVAGGALVLAFTDDPGPHRDEISARLADRDDVVFDVVQATNTEAELIDVLEQVFGDGPPPGVVGGGMDTLRNRVSFDLVDPPEGTLEALAERVDPGLACVTITRTEPIPDGPLEVLAEDPADQRLTCGGPSFPRVALDDPQPLGEVDHPAADAVRDELERADSGLAFEFEASFGEAPELVLLSLEAEVALFAAFGADGLPLSVLEVWGDGGTWRLVGFGGCNLQQALPDGLGRVEIHLDPEAPPPGPEDTTIAVVVTERGCASGQPMGERLLGPQIIEGPDQVVLVFAAAAQTGDASCPSNPATAVTVTLSSPLGGRQLVDGGAFPSAPLQVAEGDS